MAARKTTAAQDLGPAPAPVDGICVGIGGWTYAPWRSNFYPPGLVQRRELEYASRQLSAIEINGTYYGAQKPATYAKWRDETPADFVFSAKAPKRTDSTEHPSFADVTTDFVYARLMRSRSDLTSGYSDAELQRWAERARLWAAAGEPDDLPRIAPPLARDGRSRDVFVYFISSAKERNPAAAMALLGKLGAI